MDQEAKEKWVAALRSGEYRQGEGRLRTVDSLGDTYCCLGVLCDIVDGVEWSDAQGAPFGPPHRYAKYGREESGHCLPDSLLANLGMDEEDQGTLIQMNDGVYEEKVKVVVRSSFSKIADYIEANL